MPTEADTCRKFVLPKLYAAGDQRSEITPRLASHGVDFQTITLQAGKPDSDPFDLLCHNAFNGPVLTRCQHAARVKMQETAFSDCFGPEVRWILGEPLEKSVAGGEFRFLLSDVLEVPPVSPHGNVNEIIGKSGGQTNCAMP